MSVASAAHGLREAAGGAEGVIGCGSLTAAGVTTRVAVKEINVNYHNLDTQREQKSLAHKDHVSGRKSSLCSPEASNNLHPLEQLGFLQGLVCANPCAVRATHMISACRM